MFKKILCKGISVIRRMNQWWDKDEEKEISTIISGMLILLGIIILNKGILLVVAFILILNRVLHRFNLWTMMECEVNGDEVSSPLSAKPNRTSDFMVEINDKDIDDFELEEVDDEKKTDD
jgi:hypothetical protein